VWVLVAFVIAMLGAGQTRAEPRTDREAKPPKADQAHGIATPQRRGARRLVWVPRAILYIPRRTVQLALSPLRMALWAYERYELERRYYRVFFFDARRFGFYPLARLTSGFGASVGARMVHSDLFRNRGRLDAAAMYGGNYGERLALEFHSGWLGTSPVRVGGMIEYRLVPTDRFSGIGNADLRPIPDEPIDPLRRDAAVRTRFTHRYIRAGPRVTFRLAPPVELTPSVTFAHREFGPPLRAQDEPATAAAFDPRRLVGYEEGVDNVYGQLRLAVDTRRSRTSSGLTSTGWHAAAYGGCALGLPGDRSRFGRLGFDIQRFVDLWGGNRVLMLRVVGDTVIAPMARIPFVDLPTIGGPYSLRGHARDRFRDRIAAYGTAEYIYEIDHRLAGFLFVDTGRVWSGPKELELRAFRLGYGGGVQLHSGGGYIARLQVASSIEGGIHVDLNFSPPDILRDPR
jgi:hypothetical protein